MAELTILRPAHDAVSPSSAHRWLACPGSVAMCEGLPDQPSKFAAEGTLAHEQAELAALAKFKRTAWTPTTDNAEMIAHASAWADGIEKVVADVGKCLFWSAEQGLDLRGVTGRDALGTADFIAVADQGDLYIFDFKYGAGVEVDVERNPQLSIYALAAIEWLEDMYDIDRVCLVIFQPRKSSVFKQYWWDPKDLKQFGKAVRRSAELAASLIGFKDKAIQHLCPGESQCRFCKAKAICPALREKTKEVIAADFDLLETKAAKAACPPIPDDPATLARALPWLDTIEGWCEAVRARGMQMAERGEQIPGYKVVAGRRGPRKWLDGAEERLRAMRLKSADLYEKKLISPTKAEALYKAGTIGPRQWADLIVLMGQSEGKPTLVPESDKRPAISIAVADEFKQLS